MAEIFYCFLNIYDVSFKVYHKVIFPLKNYELDMEGFRELFPLAFNPVTSEKIFFSGSSWHVLVD